MDPSPEQVATPIAQDIWSASGEIFRHSGGALRGIAWHAIAYDCTVYAPASIATNGGFISAVRRQPDVITRTN
jgi:hypothetical protein